MATPRVCVLRAPGTNCDVETAYAFDSCGGSAERVHLFRLLENPEQLKQFQVLCIAGGFSYGDDIGAGVIFARQLQERIGDAIGEFLQSDKLVLGICNGFQVLLKSGILPGGADTWPPQNQQSTLTWNNNGKYTALWVRVAVGETNSVFLQGMSEFDLPIAHAEGRVTVSDPQVLQQWKAGGQVALRYTADSGVELEESGQLPYPFNPNGSIDNIAGLSDPSGRVLGLMPHPERFIHATQHPRWTRIPESQREASGRRLFENAVNYFA